ncbi:MAG: hypothetical protein M1822_003422 [Bathelium mastoideum]|nr:MAG: hypothetical protein M1822_003422 [Bathelium mastoideum]
MSFGFSVGDFLAVIQLAKKIRKDYLGAPAEFKGALDVVGSLSLVLEDAEVAATEQNLSSKEKKELQTICNGCRNILGELDHTLKKYKPEDIRNLRSRVNDNISLLNTFILRCTRDNTIEIRDNAVRIRDNTVEIVRYQESQEQRAIDQETQAILDWLTPVDYLPQQNAFMKQRQAGTGQWLLDSVEFKSWIETSKRTLFCSGIPGAGKTILASIVVEEIFTRFHHDDSTIVAYIYCNFKQQNDQTLESLLASLLKQLAQGRPSLPKSLKSLYDQSKAKKTQPSADDISAVLQSVATEYSQVFIVVDALDECRCAINLFTTSRWIPEIIEEIKQDLSLEIRAHEQDVRKYIDGRISHLPSFVRKNLDLQQEIKRGIVETVDGMFLLAQLHLDSLIGKKSVKAIRSALKTLPAGSEAYNYAYDAAMERVEGQMSDQVNLAKQVLSWITCAKRPLTTKELQHALAVEAEEAELDKDNISSIEDIISVCAGLVAVDEESHLIRLVHYTTQEYFERTQERWFPAAEADIALICVRYLSFEVFSSGSSPTDSLFEERLLLYPLFAYAARYWGYHACQVSNPHPEVVEFLRCTSNVDAAVQAMLARKHALAPRIYTQTGGMTGLHLAAYFGITEAVAEILQPSNVDLCDIAFGKTPLSHAAKRGHEAVVKLLLGTGKVDVNSKDFNSRTPLWLAAEKGHEAVVRLLLDTGKVDINSKDSECDRTPLSWAAEKGHEAIVRLLLDTGKVDIDSKDSVFGRTSLSWAAGEGHEAVVRLLLDTGKVDIDSKDSKYGRTSLSWAAGEGHKTVVRLLLDTGRVDIDLKDENSETPLLLAAGDGHEAIVKLLLNTGKVNINSKEKGGASPLLLAAAFRSEAVVKLLLDTGKADINSKDGQGQTPLSLAAGEGHEAIVKLLLDTGKVDVDSKQRGGASPLLLAAAFGHEAIVKLLLDTGKADINSKDDHNRTPLFYAAKYGHEAVVRLLLDTGEVDINSGDCWDSTPLRHAEESGYETVVKLLLDTI